MKKVNFLLIFILVITSYSNAQVESNELSAGIYETYEDYLSNNMIGYKKYVSTNSKGSRFVVEFINFDNEEVKIKINSKAKIWGYRAPADRIFRIYKNKVPYRVILKGKIVVYAHFSTHVGAGEIIVPLSSLPKISYGLGGEMLPVSKRRLEQMLIDDGANAAAFTELEKTDWSMPSLYSFIVRYNNGEF